MVVTIAKYVFNDVSKRILKGCKHIDCKYFLWRINSDHHYHDMETKPYLEDLKKHVRKHVLAILTTYIGPGLSQCNVIKILNVNNIVIWRPLGLKLKVKAL